MELVRMDELFDIEYGQREYHCKRDLPLGKTPLISSGSKNNGVYGFFDTEPRYENVISVACTGSVCCAFYHPYQCVINSNCLVLIPKQSIQSWQMRYYCQLIQAMKFKYSYGRVVTPKRLGQTEVPAQAPEWANVDPEPARQAGLTKAQELLAKANIPVDTTNWQWFNLTDLFDAEEGKGPSLRDVQENPGNIPCLTATTTNNGIACYTSLKAVYPANVLTLTKDGEPGVCFYQDKPFIVSSNVYVLHSKFNLNKGRALFLIPLIELNKGKYSYGRKLNLKRLSTDKVKLPVKQEKVDWEWIDEFMKGLSEKIVLAAGFLLTHHLTDQVLP